MILKGASVQSSSIFKFCSTKKKGHSPVIIHFSLYNIWRGVVWKLWFIKSDCFLHWNELKSKCRKTQSHCTYRSSTVRNNSVKTFWNSEVLPKKKIKIKYMYFSRFYFICILQCTGITVLIAKLRYALWDLPVSTKNFQLWTYNWAGVSML